jgi:hypothetical protein
VRATKRRIAELLAVDDDDRANVGSLAGVIRPPAGVTFATDADGYIAVCQGDKMHGYLSAAWASGYLRALRRSKEGW